MDPTSGAALIAVQLLFLAIELDQVPDDIRRCLELVRTCHKDIQHLIEMRNENMAVLQQRPNQLARVNDIIVTASNGLRQVSELVEKCRPDAHKGHTHIGKRLWWKYVDKDLFNMQRPIVERHHSAVLSELGYVRQLGLMAPVIEMAKRGKMVEQQRKQDIRARKEFENVAMLNGLMGGITLDPSPSPPGQAPPPYCAAASTSQISNAYSSPKQTLDSVQNIPKVITEDLSPLSRSSEYPYNPSVVVQHSVSISRPEVIDAQVLPNKSQHVVPSIRSDVNAGPLFARNFNNMNTAHKTPQQSSGIDEEGLAALLGGSFPATNLNPIVVNRHPSINESINSSPHINEYAHHSDLSTCSSTTEALAHGNIHPTVNIQSTLRKAHLSAPQTYSEQYGYPAENFSGIPYMQPHDTERQTFGTQDQMACSEYKSQDLDHRHGQNSHDNLSSPVSHDQPSYGFLGHNGSSYLSSDCSSDASLGWQSAAAVVAPVSNGQASNDQNSSSSNSAAHHHNAQPPSVMMATSPCHSPRAAQESVASPQPTQVLSPSISVSPLTTPAPAFSQTPYPPPFNPVHQANVSQHPSVSGPVSTQPFSTIPPGMIYGAAAPVTQTPAISTQPAAPWQSQYDWMYLSADPAHYYPSPASLAAVTAADTTDRLQAKVVSQQGTHQGAFVCYELDSDRHEPGPVELE